MTLRSSLATLVTLTAALAADTVVCAMVAVHPPPPTAPLIVRVSPGTPTIQRPFLSPVNPTIQLTIDADFTVPFPRRPNGIELFWRLAWSWPLTGIATLVVLWFIRRQKLDREAIIYTEF